MWGGHSRPLLLTSPALWQSGGAPPLSPLLRKVAITNARSAGVDLDVAFDFEKLAPEDGRL